MDSCGTDSGESSREGEGTPNRDGEVSARPTQGPPRPQIKTKVKKRRIKTFASSSTRQLQRKKAEKEELREQALFLQAQLDLLQRSKYGDGGAVQPDLSHSPAPVSSATTSEWYDQAVRQFVFRQQSEKTNRELRSILANQLHSAEALRAILQRRTLLEGMDLVFGGAAPLYRPPQSLDNSVGIMKQLEKRVEDLYLDSRAGFGWDRPSLVSSNMKVNPNTQYGKVIEIETVTPVACSIHEAAAVLWKDLKTVHEIPDKSYRYLRGSTPNSLEKNFVMKLRGQDNIIEINGSHYSRKFEDRQRIVLAKADSIILPTEGLEFRSPSLTTIATSESNPQHSVVRSYLRIYAEVQPNLDARQEDVEFARNFILNGLSKMMYGCALKTQSELIQQSLVV
ncbi:hypothetical protein P3T76_000905 [Phytophthora citrophthora]|uniref:M96 mating-specific protein family n=1 Tax=Phytophthora citrophthora TaxID=4793 RepID=A0AAD9LRA6_9STRA|nr:hypothetical protein P3T76_000905 [Phytophthora citrophthora]